MVQLKRHIAKAITYRLLGTFETITIGYILTGNLVIASSIGFIEIILKPFTYFIHERIWYKWIKYGVKNKKE